MEDKPDDDRLESSDGGGLESLGNKDLGKGIESLLLFGRGEGEKL